MFENEPYLLQYELKSSIYDKKRLGEMSQEEIDIIVKQTEIITDSFISAFRILKTDEKYMEYVNIF